MLIRPDMIGHGDMYCIIVGGEYQPNNRNAEDSNGGQEVFYF
jgi:hypothetical protein